MRRRKGNKFIFYVTSSFSSFLSMVCYFIIPCPPREQVYKLLISLFVFCAECNDGFYGQDCSFKCISTCASCNNVNGVCDSGCLPGWKGVDCRKRKIITTHSFLPISPILNHSLSFYFRNIFWTNWFVLY